MIRTALILAFVVAATAMLLNLGCTEPIKSGFVESKTVIPAHTETTFIYMPMGTDGNTMMIPMSDSVPEKYRMTIRNSGRTRDLYVSKDEYDSYQVGYPWPQPEGGFSP